QRPIVPPIRLGEIEIDIVNRQVRAGESVVHLSGIEQSLLYLLASRGGRVVSREDILDAIWGTDFVAESNIVYRHRTRAGLPVHPDLHEPGLERRAGSTASERAHGRLIEPRAAPDDGTRAEGRVVEGRPGL